MKLTRWACALALLLFCVLVCGHALDIFVRGNAPENLTEAGVYIKPVFDREDVAARLESISWAFWLFAGTAVTGTITEIFAKNKTSGKPVGDSYRAKDSRKSKKTEQTGIKVLKTFGFPMNIARTVLFVLALFFLIIGVMNGGMRDVLVKAINICTECIGLG